MPALPGPNAVSREGGEGSAAAHCTEFKSCANQKALRRAHFRCSQLMNQMEGRYDQGLCSRVTRTARHSTLNTRH